MLSFVVVVQCLCLITISFNHVDAQPTKGLITPSQTYRVGPNDELRIVVWNEDDLTTQVKISAEGKISFPLLGTLDIGGLTIKELETRITSLLAGGYLKHPTVTVYIVQYRDIYVTGAVHKPGGFPYEEGLTLTKAISLAGGLTEDADQMHIRVLRIVNGEKKTLPAQLNMPIQPDDQISVPSHRLLHLPGG